MLIDAALGLTTVDLGGGLQFSNARERRSGTHALKDLPGWYGKPSVVAPVNKNPAYHGVFPTPPATYNARYITVDGEMSVPWGQDVRTHLWQQFSALRLAPFTMTVTDPFGTLTAQVQLTDEPDFDPSDTGRYATVTIPLMAVDPLKYGPTQKVIIPASRPVLDGLRFPLFETGRLDFGVWASAGLSGKFTFFNGGTEESWPWFQADGSLAGGFQIISGPDTIEFAADVPMSKTLTMSPYAGGRAVLDGVDVTTDLLSPAWAPLQPGERREFTFVPNGAVSGGAGLTAFFREAYA